MAIEPCKSFIGNHALQFGKRPFGVGSIGLRCFLLAFLPRAPRALSDVCQILQSDKRLGMSCYDAFGDDMIGVLLQPSLSSANGDQSSCGGASAFFLQTLSQSRIMIGFGDNRFPVWKERSPFVVAVTAR